MGWANAFAAPTEADVKAAFAFNFMRFTTWPETAFDDPAAPLVVGVMAAPDILARLTVLAQGQTIRGRAVQVRPVPAHDPPTGLHMLYLGAAGQAAALAPGLRGRPVLTVSDRPDFIRQGGMIGLVPVERRVRFEINLGAARQAGLKLSARLLNLATVVAEPAP